MPCGINVPMPLAKPINIKRDIANFKEDILRINLLKKNI